MARGVRRVERRHARCRPWACSAVGLAYTGDSYRRDASGLFNDYDLLYPRPFDYDVRTAARRTGLDVELIYAIIRQESLYEATQAPARVPSD